MTDDSLLIQAESVWPGLTCGPELRLCENRVHEAERNGRRCILRLGVLGRRSAAEVEAELLWLNHLADRGVSVARPILTGGGRLFGTLDAVAEDGRAPVLATLFERAPGVLAADHPGVLTDEILLHAWGRELGKIHAVSADGIPEVVAAQRSAMEADELIANRANYMSPAMGDDFLETYDRLLARVTARSPTGTRGLIHLDLHSGNLCYGESAGRVTMFDFDECCHGRFVYDLAAPVWHETLTQDDPVEAARVFLKPFFRGYFASYDLPREELDALPDCFWFTDFMFANWCVQKGRPQDSPWVQRIFHNVRHGDPLEALDARRLV